MASVTNKPCFFKDGILEESDFACLNNDQKRFFDPYAACFRTTGLSWSGPAALCGFIKISAVRSLSDICFLHVSLRIRLCISAQFMSLVYSIVLVFAYELFGINKVSFVLVLPSGQTRTATTLYLLLFLF